MTDPPCTQVDAKVVSDIVVQAFMCADVAHTVEVLNSLKSEPNTIDAFLVTSVALATTAPETRALIQDKDSLGELELVDLPMHIRTRLEKWEASNHSYVHRVGHWEFSAEIVLYFVPGQSAFCLNYIGGDEVILEGILVGELDQGQADAWITTEEERLQKLILRDDDGEDRK